VKDIEENASILIIGTSAVAQIALQILKYKNVGEIIVVGRNMKRLEIFERFGADTIIPLENYERLSENLLKVLGNKKKFDYILDFIGSDNTLRDIIWFLAKNGEL
ncbi:MAG: zinc-binding dehydrogenase, partial [Sulfolobales archaeon]